MKSVIWDLLIKYDLNLFIVRMFSVQITKSYIFFKNSPFIKNVYTSIYQYLSKLFQTL